jgi:steroid 5-alpha reductase family enzyme
MGALELVAIAVPSFIILYVLAWALCSMVKDVTPIDGIWPLSLLLAAAIGFGLGQGDEDRRALLLCCIGLWGLRLAWHMLSRWWREGEEDKRYAVMREEDPDSFTRRSLVMVFGLQALASFVVAMPIFVVMGAPPEAKMGHLDDLAFIIIAIGLTLEIVADHQLHTFRKNPENEGKVLDTGLWALTRHPNYLGETIFWWGIWLLAVSVGWLGILSVVSPLLITGLLVFGTGKPMLEKYLAEKEGWADYASRVPGFLPISFGKKPVETEA